MTFEEVFHLLGLNEGGYVNDPRDPGGETKFGISKREYPNLDIPNLTVEDARTIYRRDYWDKASLDSLPGVLRFPVFDLAVNCGVPAAIRDMQNSVGAIADGVIGPKTLAAIAECDPLKTAVKIHMAGLERRTNSPDWPTFGKGWTRRVIRNVMTTL